MRIRIRSACFTLVALAALATALPACHGHSDYENLQACYDEHVGDEGLSITQAITVCCLDHLEDGCGDSQAACQSFVDAELDASAGASDIQAACAEYINQR